MLHRNYLKEKISCQMNEEKGKKHFSTPKVDVNFESSSSSSAEGKTEAPLGVRWHIVILLSSPRRDWRCQFVSWNLGWLLSLTRLLLFRKAQLRGDRCGHRFTGEFGRPGHLHPKRATLSPKIHICNGTDLFVTATVRFRGKSRITDAELHLFFPVMTNMKMDPALFMTKQSSVTWQT